MGFAAETHEVEKHARGKLKAKGVDLIVGNQVGEGKGFGKVQTSAWVVWKGGGQRIERCGKPELARCLVDLISERCADGKVAYLRTGSSPQ